ncbi:MAG: aspartate aminotransferase family protein [Elusimicrobia bacterium]|nr:aspartate aminotransferase family protein [Elusimicrobiota bacterium]
MTSKLSIPHSITQSPVAWAAGPKSSRLFQEEQEHIAPGLQSIALFSKIAIDHGCGAMLTDVDGREYIDFIAGIGVASLGHAHPRYVQALQEQVAKISVGSFTSEARLSWLKLLHSVTPGNLKRTQLYSSGAEAVESAIRLAKSHTGHFEVIGFWGGFHGKTGGVLGLLGDEFKKDLGPLMPGLYLAPYPNPYRCPLGTKQAHDCASHCLDFLRQLIRRSTTGRLAAIIAEPIQGTAGNVIPSPGFLKGLVQMAHEHGALFICDEMITGFGRTGKMFGCQHEEIVPDILTIGKGMACGFPVSGVITTSEIAQAKPWALPSGSSSSYGGNPLAAAACYAALQTLVEERLVEYSQELGTWMLGRLKEMQHRIPCIGDVRGRGLLMGVELVQDRETREPLPKNITRSLFEECLKRGLLSMCYSGPIRINPPLTITKSQAEEGLGKLEEALKAVSRA